MSDGEISVRFTSEEDAQLWDAFVKVQKQARAAGASLDGTNAAAGRVDASLRKFAEATKKVTATPLESLSRETKRLDEALKANLLTQGEHARAVSAAHGAYQAELRQIYAAQQKLNQQAAGPTAAVERYQQQLAKTDQAHQKNAISARQAGRAARESADGAGASFGQMRMSVLAAWGTVGATVTKILADIRADAEKAGQSLAASAGTAGTLTQIAESPADLQRLRAAARQVRAGGGADSMEAANKFVFSMQSAGAMGEIDMFTKLRNLRILEAPDEVTKYSAAVRTSFGEQKAGSFRDVLNRAFVAAGPSPEDAAQVLKGTARAGISAAQQGASIEETMALVGVLSRATGNAEDAGTNVASLMRGLAMYTPEKDKHGKLKPDSPIDKSFRGMSISDVLADKELAALSPADLHKVLGRVEAINALGVARENAAEIRQLTADTRRAKEEDLIGGKIRAVESDPELAAAARLVRVQGAAEAKSGARGMRNLTADAEQAAVVQRLREAPDPTMARRVARWAVSPTGAAISRLQGEGAFLSTAGQQLGNATRLIGGDATFLTLLQKLTGASESTDRSARAQAAAAESLERSARRLEQAVSPDRGASVDYSRAARAEAAVSPE